LINAESPKVPRTIQSMETWSRGTDRGAQILATGEAELVTWDHLTDRVDGPLPPATQG
jgi:hypothetical protein